MFAYTVHFGDGPTQVIFHLEAKDHKEAEEKIAKMNAAEKFSGWVYKLVVVL